MKRDFDKFLAERSAALNPATSPRRRARAIRYMEFFKTFDWAAQRERDKKHKDNIRKAYVNKLTRPVFED